MSGAALPARVQMTRTKRWRPDHPDAVVVARPGRFGNPFTLAMAYELGYARAGDVDTAHRAVVGAYAEWLWTGRRMWDSDDGEARRRRLLAGLPDLRGRELACWCPADTCCHGDLLLQIVNVHNAVVTARTVITATAAVLGHTPARRSRALTAQPPDRAIWRTTHLAR